MPKVKKKVTKIQFQPDYLRPAEYITEPDPRSSGFAKIDYKTGIVTSVTPKDYHETVSQYTLHKLVPEKIVIQFETAKNLYLYAWFVYRFYPVVYMQAFSCLELALRTVYEHEIPKKKYYPHSKKPMLRALLQYSIDKGDVTNDGFREWLTYAERSARDNYERSILEQTIETDEQISFDDKDIKVEDHDLQWNYLTHLLEKIPDTRNHYAHGTTALHNHSLESIRIVSEVINQIF